MTAKIKQMMNMVKMSRNPQMAMNQLMQSNPQLKQAMDFVNASGKDPKGAFYDLAQQMGVNPQDILDSLK